MEGVCVRERDSDETIWHVWYIKMQRVTNYNFMRREESVKHANKSLFDVNCMWISRLSGMCAL